jgi:outer membrane protein assembly factor BamB
MIPTRPLLLTLVALLTCLPASLPAAYGDLRWTALTDGPILGGPAIDQQGDVYVSSQDGRVYAYTAQGTLKWIFQGPTDWMESAPTIGPDGTVYAGSWDGRLYAIDGTSGSLKWAFSTGGVLTGSPAVGADGTIFIGSNDSFLYAIHSDGSQKWVSEAVPSYAPISGSPALNASGDVIYFGNDDGEFFALDATTGNLLWSVSVASIHPPASGTSVAISGAPAIDQDGSIYFACENNYLYALSYDGSLHWTFAASEPIRSSPAIDGNGTIFFAAQDGYLYAIDNLGFQISETYVGDVFYCSPAIDGNGHVLLAGYAGSATIGAASRFVSVNPAGEIAWEYLISDYNDASPNIAPDGSIYFAAHDGSLYCFEGTAPLMPNSPWPRFQANAAQSGFAKANSQEPAEPAITDFFSTITETHPDGWVFVPWFGAGWLMPRELPWVEHLELGYIFLQGPTADSVWFYDLRLNDWLYANQFAPNFYFRATAATWLYHLQGTTVYTNRWFFNYTSMEWFMD